MIKFPPLAIEQMMQYTEALLSDPSATRMWSWWLSAEAGSGNVRAAQELLADMNEIAGIQVCLDSELDVIASAISFNIGVRIAVQRVDQLLEDKRYSAERHTLFRSSKNSSGLRHEPALQNKLAHLKACACNLHLACRMTTSSVEDLFSKILGKSTSGRADPDVIKKILASAEAGSLCSPFCYESSFTLMLRAKSVKGAEFIFESMEGINTTVKAEAKVALARLRAMKEKRMQAAPLPEDCDLELQSVDLPEQADSLAEFILSMIHSRRCFLLANVTVFQKHLQILAPLWMCLQLL